MRASDADRERIAEHLRNATAEGRLLASELEDRLGAVFSARTYGELDEIVSDLPRQQVAQRPKSAITVWAPRLLALVFAVMVVAVVAVAVIAVVTGLAIWLFWMAIAWWAFGHRGRTGGPPLAHHRPPPLQHRRHWT